jgi:hypothetical protein
MNNLIALFAIPFLMFGFTVHIDPSVPTTGPSPRDVVSKVIIGAPWVLFAQGRRNAAINWSITDFSLSMLTSSLVIVVPMAQAMYGD